MENKKNDKTWETNKHLFPELYEQGYLYIGNMSRDGKTDKQISNEFNEFFKTIINTEIVIDGELKKRLSYLIRFDLRGYYIDNSCRSSSLVPVFIEIENLNLISESIENRYEILDVGSSPSECVLINSTRLFLFKDIKKKNINCNKRVKK